MRNYKYAKNEYSRFTVWFLLCVLMILFPFVILGKSLIQSGDSFNGFFPIFVYIGQWMRALLQGEVKLFDFRLGLGDDVIQVLNFHGFGDITQILSVVVPYRYAEYAYGFVMILKLWLCGISFLVYIRRYVKYEEYRVIGALTYTFSSYTLSWGFNCWIFLIPMMTFPLILAGIDKICREEDDFTKELLLGVFLQSLNGFYFLYMEVILAILYFGIIELDIFRNKPDNKLKKFIKDGLKIFWQALLAVCLGAPLFFPAVKGYLQSSRSSVRHHFGILELFAYSWDYYRSILSYLLIPNKYRNVFTQGYLSLLGIGIAFRYKVDKSRAHRQLLILLLVLYCVPLWGIIMNGFSYYTDRWMFAFVLIAAALMAIGLDMKVVLSKKEKYIFYLLAFALIVLYLSDSDFYTGKIFSIGLYLVIGILIPVVFNNRKMRSGRMCFYLAVFLIALNGLLTFGPRKVGGGGYVFEFKGRGETKQKIDQQIDSIESQGAIFERRDMYAVSLGASLIKNYYGTTIYMSMLNGNTSEFYRNLYISPGVFGANFVLKGLDGRTELDALLSVRQVMEYEEDGVEYVYRYNNTYLPMGVMFQSWIEREQFEQLNPMEKEAALIQYVVLDGEKAKVSIPKTIELDKDILNSNHEISYFVSAWNIVEDTEGFYAQEDAVIRVYLDDFYNCGGMYPVESELYVNLSDFYLHSKGTADISVGNKKIQLRNIDDVYYPGINDFWINVTKLKNDEKGQYFEILLPAGKIYSLEGLKVYEHEINYTAIEERKENSLQQLEIKTNRISGKTNCEEPGLLLFTIPYSEGWKVYVDDVEQSIYKADVGFIAIELQEGEHDIVLSYMTPGLIPGCICASVGFIILVIICYRKYKRKTTIKKVKHL